MGSVKSKRVRLMIDFTGEKAIKSFMFKLKMYGLIPDNAEVFQADGLDFMSKPGGVPRTKTYIVRDEDAVKQGRKPMEGRKV